MRARLVAAGILVTLVLTGCGGAVSPTPTPVPSVTPVPEVPASPEGTLQQRAEAAIAALAASDWEAYYQYQSPRLRRRRWPYGLDLVQPCLLDKFAVETDAAMARFRSSSGIDEDGPLTLAVNRVTMETTTAQIYVDVFYEGEMVDIGGDDEAARWALIDGEWWREDVDRGRCPEIGFGPVEETDDG